MIIMTTNQGLFLMHTCPEGKKMKISKYIHWKAIYVLWAREVIKLFRSKSRIIGSLATPLLFLIFLGFGFSKMMLPGTPGNTNYMQFMMPGIIGMGLLFSSTFAGLSLLMDREYGFLKEIMVAPVNRLSIVIGRIAGGITTSLSQGVIILIIALAMQQFRHITFLGFLMAIVFMILISTTFISFGLIFASNMRDTQGFNMIVNFIIFPLFFLSGALYPLSSLPAFIRYASYIDPLTYGVDGLRASLIGSSVFPMLYDFIILIILSVVMAILAAYFFEKSDAV